MKKPSLFLIVLLMGSLLQAQNLPSYVPANGLIGWLPFNGNANDESGNNNNGTVNGATLTTDRFGNNETAYYFNNLNGNFISVPGVSVQGSGERTISFWSKTNSNNIQNAIMAISTGSSVLSSAFNIRFETSNTFVGFMGFDNDFLGNGNVVVNDNNWHHVLVTYQSGQLRFFVDGVFEKETSISLSTLGQNNFIGKSNHDIHPDHFLGSLDDFGFWNRALTQQEITNLYQGGNSNSANCLQMPANLQQGLVGYWPFCGNALDESGNGNNGTVNGATLTSDRFGNAGSAYGFDGVDDYVSSTFPSISNEASVSLWFFTNADYNNGPNFIETSSQFCSINPSNGSIDFAQNFNTQNYFVNSGTFNPLGVWHNIVLSSKTNTNTISLYIDGILKGSTSTMGTLTPIFSYLLGKRSNNTGFFSGSLDDIAIWNRALSQQEITQLYNQGICQTSITVTDTLLIHTGITAYNPVAYQNTLKVWPNPGNQDITLDAGNLSSMQGWKYKVANTLGQTVVNETAISQQQTLIDLSTWGGNGIYYLHLINPQGHAIEIKKIVLAP